MGRECYLAVHCETFFLKVPKSRILNFPFDEVIYLCCAIIFWDGLIFTQGWTTNIWVCSTLSRQTETPADLALAGVRHCDIPCHTGNGASESCPYLRVC